MTIKPQREGMLGEQLIWLFILGDMCTFSLFFFIYGHARSEETEIFRSSQEALSISFGSINTLVLLTSSWLVVLAGRAARVHKFDDVTKFLFGAGALGCVFGALKLWEYVHKANEGISFGSNNFFMFYYLLTGLHFAHLVTGISLLLYSALAFSRRPIDGSQLNTFGSIAIFWHMVDLLWIIIFPLLYLLP
jgi:nitric oxide reductase NorE protein